MRRSTTFGVTERPVVALLLVAEIVVAVALLIRVDTSPSTTAAPVSVPVASSTPSAGTQTDVLRDGRTVEFLMLGGQPALAARMRAEFGDAADAVTAFWGDDWPRRIVVVLTGSDEQFRVIGGGGPDIAATTTAERIVFAPGASTISASSLRIVMRHELFHYAARGATAVDAPRWLTEGVADFVGRPPAPRPGPGRATELAVVPTDADLDTPGEVRSLAYDRAWWFSTFVADTYGPAALKALYVAACGVGHVDTDTAIRAVLGADRDEVLAAWRRWLAG